MSGSTPETAALQETLLVTQLLCTRLCHDLAGPVGAVAAGVELAGDDPSQVDEETLSLIGSSSAAASRKLKFLRAALGVPAAGAAAVTGLVALIEGYLDAAAGRAGAAELKWPAPEAVADVAETVGPATASLLLNLCLLVVEGLPACRRLEVSVQAKPQPRIAVVGHGEPQRTAAWRPEIVAATGGDVMGLSAKTIQPFLAGQIARANGGQVTLEAEPALLRAVFA